MIILIVLLSFAAVLQQPASKVTFLATQASMPNFLPFKSVGGKVLLKLVGLFSNLRLDCANQNILFNQSKCVLLLHPGTQ